MHILWNSDNPKGRFIEPFTDDEDPRNTISDEIEAILNVEVEMPIRYAPRYGQVQIFGQLDTLTPKVGEVELLSPARNQAKQIRLHLNGVQVKFVQDKPPEPLNFSKIPWPAEMSMEARFQMYANVEIEAQANYKECWVGYVPQWDSHRKRFLAYEPEVLD